MQGFAYVAAGEKEIRADEDIPWYASDDAWENKARVAGGVVMIPGFHVNHLYPNAQMVPELYEANARGMGIFVERYGYHPFL